MNPLRYVLDTVVYGLLTLAVFALVLAVYVSTTDPVLGFVLLLVAALLARLVPDLDDVLSGHYDGWHLVGLTVLMAIAATVLTALFSAAFAPWAIYIVAALVAHLAWDWFESAVLTHRPVHSAHPTPAAA